jgi:hypothetical protein
MASVFDGVARLVLGRTLSVLGRIDRVIRSNSRAASQAFPRFAHYDKAPPFGRPRTTIRTD